MNVSLGSKWLAEGEVLEIRDDITARVFLDEIGLLERLPKNSADQPIMAVVVEADHPTHAIVATYITGHPERVDNGHTVICFPKPRFTPTDVETYIQILQKAGEVMIEGWRPRVGWPR